MITLERATNTMKFSIFSCTSRGDLWVNHHVKLAIGWTWVGIKYGADSLQPLSPCVYWNQVRPNFFKSNLKQLVNFGFMRVAGGINMFCVPGWSSPDDSVQWHSPWRDDDGDPFPELRDELVPELSDGRFESCSLFLLV